MASIKVSIIIPIFNSADTVSETIESILRQTYKEWEIVCVDDGSTDDSALIIEKYVEKDKRIRLIYRNRLPKGGSVCRNIGVSHASGDYLIFLDSDDLLTQTCLENRVYYIEKNKYDLMFCLAVNVAVFVIAPLISPTLLKKGSAI